MDIRQRALPPNVAVGTRAATPGGVLRTSPVTLMVVLLLHFCSPTAALNALAPRDGIALTRDIAGSAPAQNRMRKWDGAAPGSPCSMPVVVISIVMASMTASNAAIMATVRVRPGAFVLASWFWSVARES